MSIKSDLDELKAKVLEKEETELKDKRWRLPWKAKVGKKKQSKNWIGILKLNENGSIEPSKQQIKQQTVLLDGVPRLSTPDYVFRWNAGRKQFPVLIVPSWSVKPLCPKEDFQKSMEDGSNTKGYKLLMERMQQSKVEEKKSMGGWLKWVIGLGLLGVVIYAFASGSIF